MYVTQHRKSMSLSTMMAQQQLTAPHRVSTVPSLNNINENNDVTPSTDENNADVTTNETV